MAIKVTISDITGATPYDIYICQPDGTSCFYIDTIASTELPYEFDIPVPYDTANQYMLKAIDNNSCIITGTTTI
jgi:hypothetical protein